MARHRFRGMLLAASLLALPAGLQAQQAQPASPAQPSQEQLQGWMSEMEQLHLRLQSLQQQALQDPALSQAQEELGTSIKAAMEQADPELEQSLARVTELEGEARAAQQAGDAAKLQEITAQAQQIQMRFFAAQQKVMQQPEMAAQINAFQTRLESRMLELDPEAPQTIARFRELEGMLAGALEAAQR